MTTGSWSCRIAGDLNAGELTIESGFLSGLRNLFALLAPEPGDRLLLVFDMHSRNVEARVGEVVPNDLAQLAQRDLEDDDDDHSEDPTLDDLEAPL